MLEFTPFRSVVQNMPQNSLKVSIDTLELEANKRTLESYLKKRGFSILMVKAHSKISANAKKKRVTKEVTSLYQVQMKNFSNILLDTPHALNQKSNYKKYHLTAFGLSQYHKPLHVEAKRELEKLFNRFGVTKYDLTIDRVTPVKKNSLRAFGVLTSMQNTLYINQPLFFSYIERIRYYDKAFKDGLDFPLYRIELTIKCKGKLKDMFIPYEEVQRVINTVA